MPPTVVEGPVPFHPCPKGEDGPSNRTRWVSTSRWRGGRWKTEGQSTPDRGSPVPPTVSYWTKLNTQVRSTTPHPVSPPPPSLQSRRVTLGSSVGWRTEVPPCLFLLVKLVLWLKGDGFKVGQSLQLRMIYI